MSHDLFSQLAGMDSAIMDSDVEDDDGDDSVSFRMVLPSESHRKQSIGRLRSASESVSSLATSHGDLSGVCVLEYMSFYTVLAN